MSIEKQIAIVLNKAAQLPRDKTKDKVFLQAWLTLTAPPELSYLHHYLSWIIRYGKWVPSFTLPTNKTGPL